MSTLIPATTPTAPSDGRRTAPLAPTLAAAVGLLLAMDLVGAWISVGSGLSPTFLDALGSNARLSAPLPMMIAQAVVVCAATRSRRAVAAPASALLVVAGLLAFLSGFFDGGYADPSLTPTMRVFQVTLVAAHLVMSVLAGARLVTLLHR
jgi:hypothetical protein